MGETKYLAWCGRAQNKYYPARDESRVAVDKLLLVSGKSTDKLNMEY